MPVLIEKLVCTALSTIMYS